MKVLSILLMLAGLLITLAYGLIYLFAFAMSFDAPGSDKQPLAWAMRFLMFLPVIMALMLLVFSYRSYAQGHYQRAAGLSSIISIAGLIFYGFMMVTSFASLRSYRKELAEEKRMAELYPKQNFLRPRDNGMDTIIVWPNRIVAYRLFMGEGNRDWGGPLGDLNESRDSLIFLDRPDTRLRREELDQFVDPAGRRFTDVYSVR